MTPKLKVDLILSQIGGQPEVEVFFANYFVIETIQEWKTSTYKINYCKIKYETKVTKIPEQQKW